MIRMSAWERAGQAPSRLNPNTGNIQLDTAGESAAIKPPK